MTYKGNDIVVIEKKDYLIIRLQNKYGFRWFEAPLGGKTLNIKKAVEIEQDIQDNGFKSKYAFGDPIRLF